MGEYDYGSDHVFLIAKFRLILKKVGKTTRPFRYNLNEIPYDCTVEVTNRSGRQCLKNYRQRFITFTGGDDQNHPQEKEIQKGKVAV